MGGFGLGQVHHISRPAKCDLSLSSRPQSSTSESESNSYFDSKMEVINMMGHLLNEEQSGDKMRYYFDTRAVQLMVQMDLENCTRISERRLKMEKVWSSYVKYKKTDVNEIIKADLVSVTLCFSYWSGIVFLPRVTQSGSPTTIWSVATPSPFSICYCYLFHIQKCRGEGYRNPTVGMHEEGDTTPPIYKDNHLSHFGYFE